MATRYQVAPRRSFEEFNPTFQWTTDNAGAYILSVNLPGFKREELKIELSNYGKLQITGERALDDKKWSRFRKDFQLPECQLDKIKANFQGGVLYVTMPKHTEIVQQNQQAQAQETPTPRKPLSKPESGGSSGRKIAQGVDTGKPTMGIPKKEQQKSGDTPVSEKTDQGVETGRPRMGIPGKEQQKSGDSIVGQKPILEVPEKQKVAEKMTQRTPKKENLKTDESVDDEKSKEGVPEKVKEMGNLDSSYKVCPKYLQYWMRRKPRGLGLSWGVTMVAVVALGFYVNYKFRSSHDLED